MHKITGGKKTGLNWLTAREKTYWLERLAAARRDKFVDPEFLPYLDEINALDNVCTCFCCTGHAVGRDGEKKPGYLMFRLKSRVKNRFLDRAFLGLLALPGVKFIDLSNKAENFAGQKGIFPFVQITWAYDAWPEIIGPIVRELKKIK